MYNIYIYIYDISNIYIYIWQKQQWRNKGIQATTQSYMVTYLCCIYLNPIWFVVSANEDHHPHMGLNMEHENTTKPPVVSTSLVEKNWAPQVCHDFPHFFLCIYHSSP